MTPWARTSMKRYTLVDKSHGKCRNIYEAKNSKSAEKKFEGKNTLKRKIGQLAYANVFQRGD